MNPYAAMLLAAGAALGVTALLGYVFIPWLHKLKFGQIILDIGPSWHKHKQGTPTMGGLMFIIGILVSVALVFVTDFLLGGKMLKPEEYLAGGFAPKMISGLIMAALFGLMGFLDDYIKVAKKRNKGLSITQKTVMQLLISLGYIWTLWNSMRHSSDALMGAYTLVPFVGQVQLSWFFWVFAFVVIYATTNAVNFTDGVDGLCSGVTVVAGAGFAVFAAMRGLFGASVVSAAMAGGCGGFLIWNRNPAKVIMGDTGSMFLGGLLVAISFALDCPVILVLLGLIYVIEGLSDVIQIGYFKLTGGKRIFKMAPIHHHFEMSGWNEKKIGVVFSLVNLLGVVAGLMVAYYGLRAFLAW